MVARTTRSIVNFLHSPFQFACYGFVWFACGYVILMLLKEMLGDTFLDNFGIMMSF